MRANEGLAVGQTDDGPKLSHYGIMHCCTANGARTLYYVWDSILSKSGDEVCVNLLLNRASAWVDVDSYVPVEGKVVLHIKDAASVAVRIPEWGDPSGVRVQVNGDELPTVVEGRYMRVSRVTSGDRVELTMPVPERTVHRVIGEVPYALTVRGSTVMSIDPKGVALPLFENPPTAKSVRTTRFVPNVGNIVW